MKKIRRYDLDWLRVLVFALLILYHVGMFFVPWGWHIKNNEIYGWLRYPMLFVNQWRLPILFVISGMGTAYALSFRSAIEFVRERLLRLLVPLMFGMLVIVPPQVYVERLVHGQYQGSYFQWLQSGALFNGIYPEGSISWHHLWFLPYLLVFSLVLTPAFIAIRSNPQSRILTVLKDKIDKQPYFLLLFAIPLYFYEALLEPYFAITHNLVWDWFNFISSMTLLFYGYLLISIRDTFWKAAGLIWKNTFLLGIICFTVLLFIWLFFDDSVVIHFTEALVKVTNLWTWIITIFGASSMYLNQSSRFISYANRAVYPFYILHQTITVLIGYLIYDLSWGLLPKFIVMCLGTFCISFLIYHFMIRPVRFLWPLFGLKR